MKLYKIYEELIFEEIEKTKMILTEGISGDEAKKIINGVSTKNGSITRFNVNILYSDDPKTPPSKRYIQVYVYGQTTAGNDAIRAYQIGGGSKTESTGWKIFRLDKIKGWYVTQMKWYKPISDYDPNTPKYNENGDLTFGKIYSQVRFKK